MAYWLIQIKDDGSVPELLPFLFDHQQGLSTDFIKEGNSYYMKTEDANSEKTVTEVVRETNKWLSFLNGNISFHLGIAGTLTVTKTVNVTYCDDLGNRITADFPLRLRLMDPLSKTAFSKHPNFIETQAMANDPKILEALRNYTDPATWFGLYNVFDVIKKDCEQTKNASNFYSWTRDATGNPRNKDFTESANNPYLSGFTARHAYADDHKPQQDPQDPDVWIVKEKGKDKKIYRMSLSEAKSFIDHVLEKWLELKLELVDSSSEANL